MGSAARVYRSLQGLFAVYKPPGVHWKLVRDTVETSLIRDLNSLGSPAPRQAIRFLPGRSEGTDRSELTLTAARLPVLADHPLVKGPEFHGLKVGAGHRLDVRSSGVFVLGVGHGNKLLTDMYSCHLPRYSAGAGSCRALTAEYTLQGLFGKATDDFSDSGRLIEKTTLDHISRDKLEKILAVIQGTNQKALLAFSGVDLKSQEAYELAVKGLLRHLQKTPPIITGSAVCAAPRVHAGDPVPERDTPVPAEAHPRDRAGAALSRCVLSRAPHPRWFLHTAGRAAALALGPAQRGGCREAGRAPGPSRAEPRGGRDRARAGLKRQIIHPFIHFTVKLSRTERALGFTWGFPVSESRMEAGDVSVGSRGGGENLQNGTFIAKS
ncbi:mitochondrial mRNA pseudouridine synthase Trub2-like [Acipenser oxyrinchus oxyrinchus]|uniref:Mitochondrial mRNA pseudouridine synthase Trub2-like n=1 Tax=Acipenser oxyrinchus oxyrinchus TaxID=40147 RepID=A0AAD8CCX2_ACIOX|nr:mitochondrial mRNA pseudouridine synthase Trub2-like [Acipenser oxyrinchus oxyrinchus]